MAAPWVEHMTALWDRCRREGASLNEIVAAFEAEGDVSELVAAARREDQRTSALYVLAELPTSLSRPVWRRALEYVADPDDRIAFYALDLFHSFSGEAEPNDLRLIIQSTRLSSPALLAKLFAIMISVPEDLMQRSAKRGIEPMPSSLSNGLRLLAEGSSVAVREIRAMLKHPAPLERFFGACLIGRHHPRDASLRKLLPAPLEERLALHFKLG